MKALPVRGLAAGLAAVLAACSLAPHYQRPATAPPSSTYKEAGDWKV